MNTSDEVHLRLPLDLDNLDGPHTTVKAWVVAKRAGAGIATLDDQTEIMDEPDWAEPCGDVYFEVSADATTLRAIRPATKQDYEIFRVPIWIQGEQTPACCGELMSYVGCLDDDCLWQEPPAGAIFWWHDAVRFYVFTCPKCLAVAAVGQQS